jgi:transcription elongation factor Elf1
MANNGPAGEVGEKDLIKKVPCPNCGKALMGLPKNYPMYDVQCTGCTFRAQVKTNNSKPKSEIFGAGWDIIEKVMKAGFVVPALFANFVWERQR